MYDRDKRHKHQKVIILPIEVSIQFEMDLLPLNYSWITCKVKLCTRNKELDVFEFGQ